MQASDVCLNFIKRNEGLSLTPYLDSGGVPTIGWGTTRYDDGRRVKMTDPPITVEQAQHYLEREVHRVEDAVNQAVKVPLTQAEFDCIVDFGYNVGTGWITGQGHTQASFIKLLNQGKYSAVPAGLLLFTRDIHGRQIQGLVNRRKWEAQMWLAGENDHSHIAAAVPQNQPGGMPQAVMPAKAETAATTVRTSPTIWAAIAGGLATFGHYVDSLFGFTKSIAQSVLDTQTELGPIATLWGLVCKNSQTIAIGVALIAFVVVIARKLQDRATAKAF
ncbi:MAG TPA: lysozyme [Hyphomicrobiales bacterium]|nr:lysozyme [Hyphomicrobiales bacterium]